MEAKELRLGNLISVYRKPTDKELSHYAVQEIYEWENDENYYVVIDDTFSVNIETGIIPIPLTEDWLLKFGFKGWDLGKYTLILTNGNFFDFQHGLESTPIAKNIKHVHQLQNLYFALTGEELTIKEVVK